MATVDSSSTPPLSHKGSALGLNLEGSPPTPAVDSTSPRSSVRQLALDYESDHPMPPLPAPVTVSKYPLGSPETNTPTATEPRSRTKSLSRRFSRRRRSLAEEMAAAELREHDEQVARSSQPFLHSIFDSSEESLHRQTGGTRGTGGTEGKEEAAPKKRFYSGSFGSSVGDLLHIKVKPSKSKNNLQTINSSQESLGLEDALSLAKPSAKDRFYSSSFGSSVGDLLHIKRKPSKPNTNLPTIDASEESFTLNDGSLSQEPKSGSKGRFYSGSFASSFGDLLSLKPKPAGAKTPKTPTRRASMARTRSKIPTPMRTARAVSMPGPSLPISHSRHSVTPELTHSSVSDHASPSAAAAHTLPTTPPSIPRGIVAANVAAINAATSPTPKRSSSFSGSHKSLRPRRGRQGGSVGSAESFGHHSDPIAGTTSSHHQPSSIISVASATIVEGSKHIVIEDAAPKRAMSVDYSQRPPGSPTLTGYVRTRAVSVHVVETQEVEPEPEPEAKPKPEVETGAEQKPVAEPVAEPQAKAEVEAEPEAVAEPEPAPEAEQVAEAEAMTVTEAEAVALPESKVVAEAVAEAEVEAEVVAESAVTPLESTTTSETEGAHGPSPVEGPSPAADSGSGSSPPSPELVASPAPAASPELAADAHEEPSHDSSVDIVHTTPPASPMPHQDIDTWQSEVVNTPSAPPAVPNSSPAHSRPSSPLAVHMPPRSTAPSVVDVPCAAPSHNIIERTTVEVSIPIDAPRETIDRALDALARKDAKDGSSASRPPSRSSSPTPSLHGRSGFQPPAPIPLIDYSQFKPSRKRREDKLSRSSSGRSHSHSRKNSNSHVSITTSAPAPAPSVAPATTTSAPEVKSTTITAGGVDITVNSGPTPASTTSAGPPVISVQPPTPAETPAPSITSRRRSSLSGASISGRSERSTTAKDTVITINGASISVSKPAAATPAAPTVPGPPAVATAPSVVSVPVGGATITIQSEAPAPPAPAPAPVPAPAPAPSVASSSHSHRPTLETVEDEDAVKMRHKGKDEDDSQMEVTVTERKTDEGKETVVSMRHVNKTDDEKDKDSGDEKAKEKKKKKKRKEKEKKRRERRKKGSDSGSDSDSNCSHCETDDGKHRCTTRTTTTTHTHDAAAQPAPQAQPMLQQPQLQQHWQGIYTPRPPYLPGLGYPVMPVSFMPGVPHMPLVHPQGVQMMPPGLQPMPGQAYARPMMPGMPGVPGVGYAPPMAPGYAPGYGMGGGYAYGRSPYAPY